MMTKQINTFQLALILAHAQIGVGMITLANDVHEVAKTDSWLSILMAGVIIQLLIFLYGSIMKRFPNETFFEVLELMVGKVIGKITNLIYIVYFIAIGSLLLAKYAVILKSWMMPLTPNWILTVTLSVLGVYAAKENLHVISRFFILATFVIFIFIGFIIYSFKDANYTYILPVGQAGFTAIFKGAFTSATAYQGVWYLLVLSPFVKASNGEIIKVSTIVNGFVTLFYLFIVLASQLFFSPRELDIITEPIFYLVKSLSFSLVQRPDLVFTSLWVVLVVTSVIVLYFVTSLGLGTLFSTKQRTPFVYIFALASVIASIFVYGEFQVDYFTEMLSKLIFIFSLGIPLLILLLSYLLNKKGESKGE